MLMLVSPLMALRESRGLSVEAAAKACRVSVEEFDRLEHGDLVPSVALKVARGLGVDVASVVEGC